MCTLPQLWLLTQDVACITQSARAFSAIGWRFRASDRAPFCKFRVARRPGTDQSGADGTPEGRP
jgi:hypothetical protein